MAMRGLVALLVLVGVVAASCTTGTEPTTTGDEGTSSTSITVPDDTERGIVTGVINGDTLQVMIGSERRVIRLAGIRAPRDDECYAAEASRAVSEVAAGRTVAVVGGATDADGTELRYLIIEGDVPILVNMELVDRGAAVALHGHELAGDFLRVNDRAYASGRGMWGTFVCGQPPDAVAADRPQLRIQAVRTSTGDSSASVVIVNASYTEVALDGWAIRDASNASRFTFPRGTVLASGDELNVAVTCESETASGLSWCADSSLWSAGGNTLIIQDERGNVVDLYVHETGATP